MTVTVLKETGELYTMRSGEQRPVLLVDKDGEEKRAVKLDNGTLQEIGTGYFLAPPDDDHKPITKANASSIVKIRWDKFQEASLEGLKRHSVKECEYDAWSHIVERQAALAQDTEQGRASTAAAEFVGKSVGALVDRRQLEEPGTAAATLSLSLEAVKAIHALLAGRGEVIDAEFKNL